MSLLESEVETYELHIQDDRYTIPTLLLEMLASPGRARARAAGLLLSSQHHTRVDVYRGGTHIYTVGGDRGRVDDGRAPAHESSGGRPIRPLSYERR